MQETNSVHVQRVLVTSQTFHQLIFHQENVPGKHQHLLVKDIEDVITKHRAEVTFASAESQKLCNSKCHNSLSCENK